MEKFLKSKCPFTVLERPVRWGELISLHIQAIVILAGFFLTPCVIYAVRTFVESL